MNNRENTLAILNYEEYSSLPIVHFGFWDETLQKWHKEGHLTEEEIKNVYDGSPNEKIIGKKLGFDYNWFVVYRDNSDVLSSLYPPFERKIIEKYPDGKRKVINEYGVIELEKPGARSIPTEVDHLLKDRESWEKHFLPRLQFSEERIDKEKLRKIKNCSNRENPLGLFCGSLFGQIRNWMGIKGISYLYTDDEDLFDEIIETVGELNYQTVEYILTQVTDFDFGHFWEDICFKSGPLFMPDVYNEKVGPYYNKITNLLNEYGIEIVSLDCDGKIDALIPTWIHNGVNTMFPIEVGTWNGNIKPWREKYGKKFVVLVV